MKVVLEAQIDGIASKVDGTVTIKISSQELDKSAAGDIFGLRGKHCKVLLSDSNISTLEEEMIDNTSLVIGKKQKSESQRLRAVLYRYWEQKTEGDFELFYKSEMNKIIEHYKSKLE